ncbi:hypothetical protein GDO86_006946 [Hymenochirus boettgeri]|uniref:Transmembrane protein 205 n=1 Tax=Hymenochirus boettgeri TaxID=247094 RepID=A0A8T2JCZ3_9PIPI|nr:hypothetical protein GDO86_006946 [Hymenochirus boettgeri]
MQGTGFCDMFLTLCLHPGFVMIANVPRHTFGLVQSKLIPFYHHILLCFIFVNLAIFASYHPRELLSPAESIQIVLFLISLITNAMNARWFSPVISKIMFKVQVIEKEHGLGQEVGRSANKEGYRLLQNKDPKYCDLRRRFMFYHAISSFSNLLSFLCNGANLVYIAAMLPTL